MNDLLVIDCHVHLYPDTVAEKVVPALGKKFGNKPAFDGTVAGALKTMEAAGISALINLPVATTDHQVNGINIWAKQNNSRPIFSLAAFHPALPNKASTLQAIHAAGFRGIKLHPEYQHLDFNDPQMDEVWETCQSLGLLVFLHAGGERVFTPPFHSHPADILKLHQRFPKLTLVAAHLGGFNMWDEAEALLMGTSIYLDLSHTFFWMDTNQIIRMIQKHGTDKILFGTDAPWQEPKNVLAAFLKLPFPRSDLARMAGENASALFMV